MCQPTGISDALKTELEKLAGIAEILWQKGWAERNAGNISADVTELCSHLDEFSYACLVKLLERVCCVNSLIDIFSKELTRIIARESHGHLC